MQRVQSEQLLPMTVLMRAMLGTTRVDAGDIANLRPDKTLGLRSRLQYTYQDPGASLDPRWKIRASLHEPLMGKLFHSGRFNARRFGRILDVGSGAGQIIRHLLATGRPDTEIVGFDLSWEMLKRARERLNSDRPVFVALPAH